MKIKRSDIIAGIIAGELISVFLWIVVFGAQLEATAKFSLAIRFLRWPAFLAIPVLIVAGLFVAEILSRWWRAIWQLAKFFVVGLLNTALDLGVFNILKVASGVGEAGLVLTIFKGISFIAAVTNSFVWNKFWVFEKKGAAGAGKEFVVFFVISAVGITLNGGVFYLLTAVVGAPERIPEAIWHDISVLLSGLAVFAWNFLGYKFIVFRTTAAPKHREDVVATSKIPENLV